jgi:large subunit ribosomal protein L10
MKKEDKSLIIKQLSETLGTYSNFYLTDIEALNASKTNALRRLCFKKDI